MFYFLEDQNTDWLICETQFFSSVAISKQVPLKTQNPHDYQSFQLQKVKEIKLVEISPEKQNLRSKNNQILPKNHAVQLQINTISVVAKTYIVVSGCC